ncbi:MAG: head GIN domain-containing protein [Flavobacteriaceae bacterium]
MKILSTLFLAILTSNVFSQGIITKEVGDFNELKVYDLIEVTLIQSTENKVVIKGEDTQDVSIINKNGMLKVKMNADKIFRGEDTYVEVYFKNIDIIDANEGAQIVGNEMISQNTIELRAQEGGRIKVGLEANHTKIKAVSGGIVEASGISKSQEILLNSGGIFEGRDLKTEDTKIGITAAGEADINASNKVDVKVTAGGDVYIYGNPKTVNEKSFAGGRIKRMN